MVVSDLTSPPREGLHQQTLLLVASLRRAGLDVDLLGFCRDPETDASLRRADGQGFDRPPVRYRGSSLLAALATAARPRREVWHLIEHIERGGYDVVHLDGVVAASLAGRIHAPTVVSWVDPGSRRFLRFARSPHVSALRRPAYLVAARAARLLESYVARRSRNWHVVSPEDVAYLEREYTVVRTTGIPVMLPADVARLGAERLVHGAPDAAVSNGGVLVFADLRQRAMREACASLLGALASHADGRDLPIRVLGRVAPTDEVIDAGRGLQVEYLAWVDDYVREIVGAGMVVLPDVVGTGLKNRTLQSLALGALVVGTDVAFEGIPARSGDEAVVVSGGMRHLAEAVVAASKMAPDARGAMALRGAEFALANYAPRSVTASWVALYGTARAAASE